MEKLYTCVACAKRFKVLSRPDNAAYKQHEVEMNVECPFCSKTNAIAWPQDESLPLVVTEDGQPSQHQRGVEVQILSTAKELISGRLGVIAASRELSRFRQDVEQQIADVLLTFVGIDSETDTLPVGGVRKEWNREALERKDKEIAEAERIYRNSAMTAAAELIRLLDMPS
jgi:DNA-directed RNA polymerase subunit RPC12/RpoP